MFQNIGITGILKRILTIETIGTNFCLINQIHLALFAFFFCFTGRSMTATHLQDIIYRLIRLSDSASEKFIARCVSSGAVDGKKKKKPPSQKHTLIIQHSF